MEASIVIEARFGAEGVRHLDRFLDRAGVTFMAVDVEQGNLARQAISRFGKGRHVAGLNFGDCFSYALAQVLGEPLLYKGEDFPQTDVSRYPLHVADEEQLRVDVEPPDGRSRTE